MILLQNDLSNSESPCRPDASHQILVQSDLQFWSRCGWWFGDFQDGHHGTEQFLQFLISMSLQCLLSSFSSIKLMVWEGMSFKEFQDSHSGSHLGYMIETIIAVLNLHVSPMPPTKFRLNPPYHLGADADWRFSKWPPWHDFSSSEFLCHSNASHQVSAQIDLRFERRCGLKNFEIATMAAILDIGKEWF